METFFCAAEDSHIFCSIQTISWAIPFIYLLLLLLIRSTASQIRLYRNKNVNISAYFQYFVILLVPIIEILSLLLFSSQKVSIARFLSHVCSFGNAIICCGLMKAEFLRMISPGVFSFGLRLYFLWLFIAELAYMVLITLSSIETGLISSLIISESLKIAIIFSLNALSFLSFLKAKRFNLKPLLYEESNSPTLQIDTSETCKNEEDNEEYRMTRSQSVMNNIPPADFLIKNGFPEYLNEQKNTKSINVEITKVLISQDSNKEIIVLYEIKIYDNKGKILRTIYRRFSEFESLHNEVFYTFSKRNLLKIEGVLAQRRD